MGVISTVLQNRFVIGNKHSDFQQQDSIMVTAYTCIYHLNMSTTSLMNTLQNYYKSESISQ